MGRTDALAHDPNIYPKLSALAACLEKELDKGWRVEVYKMSVQFDVRQNVKRTIYKVLPKNCPG